MSGVMTEKDAAMLFPVELGAVAVAATGVALVVEHLTSGLAVVVYDGVGVVGVAYSLRGRAEPGDRSVEMRPALFVDHALPELLRMMAERGAREECVAAIVGGAAGVGWRRSRDMSLDAAATARGWLAKAGIAVRFEAVGGTQSRTLQVDGSGRLQLDTAREPRRVVSLAVTAAAAGGRP
jgi:chemotaxis receptor (MCP) glutamine deamidase CheD